MKSVLLPALVVFAFFGVIGAHMRGCFNRPAESVGPVEAPEASLAFGVVEANTGLPGLQAAVGVFCDRQTGEQYILVSNSRGVAITRREPLTKAGNPAEGKP